MAVKVKCLLFFLTLLLLGCTPGEEVLKRRGEADYTVILYGCAGGNLDDSLKDKISQLFNSAYNERIHLTALVKYSESMQHKRLYSGTRRYSLINRYRVENERYADASFALNNPDNFASFIAETKRRMPAKHYILILWNHGEEFSIFDQPLAAQSRAILYDDNLSYLPLSIFEMEEALRRAYTHFDAIIFDACRMASAEYIFEIDRHADFIVAPSHNIYGGMNYDKFVTHLTKSSHLTSALAKFINSTMERWRQLPTSETMDLSLFDMSFADDFLASIARCSEALLSLRNSLDEEGLSRYNRLNKSYQKICSDFYGEEGMLYFINPEADCSIESVDIIHHLASFAKEFDHTPLREAVRDMQLLAEDFCIVNYTHNLTPPLLRTSLAVKWSYSHLYTKDYTREYIERVGREPQFSTLKDIYPLLRFDKATSWHLLLEGNMLE